MSNLCIEPINVINPAINGVPDSEKYLKSHSIYPFVILNPNQQTVLAQLAASKRVIGCFVRAKSEFFEDLEGLRKKKPEDAGLVAIVPKSSPSSNENFKNAFDVIIYYDISNSVIRELQSTEDAVYPDLRAVVDEIMKIVPRGKVQLIHTDELSMTEVGRLRERHGLMGAYPHDLDRLCCKNQLAQLAKKAGVAIPKTIFLDFTHSDSLENLLEKVQLEIGSFPMFAKLNRMFGCRGIAKIVNQENLENWLTERLSDDVPMPYVLQEFIEAIEFGVVVLLLPDGTWEPLIVHLFHGTTFRNVFLEDEPLIMGATTMESALKDQFPRLDFFTQKVIDAFKPVQPQILFIQGFQLSPKTDQYVLIELNYRPCGERGNAALYDTCGIRVYTALTLAHIDPHYRPVPDSGWKPKIATMVSYASKKGIVRSHNEAILRANVKSETEWEWSKKPGTHIPRPLIILDSLVRITLYSKNEEDRDADLKWIQKHWRPDVIKDSTGNS
ncbi:hypothetical protein L596_020531 [Steinernema carpocapsae]|uniref:ATP-grasp domain-containing protein n=1 Tax=Steinernema carpocapsae TaxID=34508 RepID=A0A4U5MUH0_STECR|nr:hypothetical protein L596_020531 [Steinernema carpocapsae]